MYVVFVEQTRGARTDIKCGARSALNLSSNALRIRNAIGINSPGSLTFFSAFVSLSRSATSTSDSNECILCIATVQVLLPRYHHSRFKTLSESEPRLPEQGEKQPDLRLNPNIIQSPTMRPEFAVSSVSTFFLPTSRGALRRISMPLPLSLSFSSLPCGLDALVLVCNMSVAPVTSQMSLLCGTLPPATYTA